MKRFAHLLVAVLPFWYFVIFNPGAPIYHQDGTVSYQIVSMTYSPSFPTATECESGLIVAQSSIANTDILAPGFFASSCVDSRVNQATNG